MDVQGCLREVSENAERLREELASDYAMELDAYIESCFEQRERAKERIGWNGCESTI